MGFSFCFFLSLFSSFISFFFSLINSFLSFSFSSVHFFFFSRSSVHFFFLVLQFISFFFSSLFSSFLVASLFHSFLASNNSSACFLPLSLFFLFSTFSFPTQHLFLHLRPFQQNVSSFLTQLKVPPLLLSSLLFNPINILLSFVFPDLTFVYFLPQRNR